MAINLLKLFPILPWIIKDVCSCDAIVLAPHPVQHLMTRFADRTGVNRQSFQSALAALDNLKEAGAAVFKTQPGAG
jgi:hypothetical protein